MLEFTNTYYVYYFWALWSNLGLTFLISYGVKNLVLNLRWKIDCGFESELPWSKIHVKFFCSYLDGKKIDMLILAVHCYIILGVDTWHTLLVKWAMMRYLRQMIWTKISNVIKRNYCTSYLIEIRSVFTNHQFFSF